jgi:DNA-binding ferritin-like protein
VDPHQHKTRIDLGEPLAVRLADPIDLALQARQAHRNVKGPQFAARLTAFGGTAEGTALVVAKRRSLEPYPLAIAAADGPGDPVIAESFSGIAGAIDRQRWLVEALRQAQR